MEEGARRLEQMRERFHTWFKRLSLEYHPDHTGNDPVLTEKFRVLVEMKKELGDIPVPEEEAPPKVVPIKPPKPQVVHSPEVPKMTISYYVKTQVQPMVPPKTYAPSMSVPTLAHYVQSRATRKSSR